MRITHLILPLLLIAANHASAASSDWIVSEGGAVRLLTSGLADQNGRLRGALEIVLKDGWKTYWRDPGRAGVPPQVDLKPGSPVHGAEILFPPPQRIKDDYATWAGYTQSVTLPILFTLPSPGSAGIIEGTVFLGICKTICIPVQGTFAIDAGADPYNRKDAIRVEAAFASLPGKARSGFEIASASREGERVLFNAETVGASGDPILFVAPSGGGQLSTPKLIERRGTVAVFAADIINAPDEAMQIHYTLSSDAEAVDGMIELP